MSGAGVPILTYHSIDSSGSVISTSPRQFRAHMEHLRNEAFHVAPLSDLVERLRRHEPLPERTVAITFDDGLRNLYDVAYPVLRDLGFPATVFLVAGHCGGDNQWRSQPPGLVPRLEMLTWRQLAEMVPDGIEVGAHTLSHPDLTQLSSEEATNEIVGSKTVIERQLGVDVPLFAYPYGRATPAARAVVRQHFAGACTTELRTMSAASDPHELPRLEMYYFSTNDRFNQLGRPPFERYLAWRRAWRALRRLGRG